MSLVAGIDLVQSTVLMRNPHHKNSPDAKGVNGEDDDGEFTLTIDQVLRAFSTVASGVVEAS